MITEAYFWCLFFLEKKRKEKKIRPNQVFLWHFSTQKIFAYRAPLTCSKNICVQGPPYVFNGLELHQSDDGHTLYGKCPQFGGRIVYQVEQITPDELISLLEVGG